MDAQKIIFMGIDISNNLLFFFNIIRKKFSSGVWYVKIMICVGIAIN